MQWTEVMRVRVLLLILLLTGPAWAGYLDDANHPPRVSIPGRGFVMPPPTVVRTVEVLPAQVPAPIVTVPSVNPTPFFPSSVPPILTVPEDQLPGITTPGRPLPTGPAGY